jgi:hypothetical protein
MKGNAKGMADRKLITVSPFSAAILGILTFVRRLSLLIVSWALSLGKHFNIDLWRTGPTAEGCSANRRKALSAA